MIKKIFVAMTVLTVFVLPSFVWAFTPIDYCATATYDAIGCANQTGSQAVTGTTAQPTSATSIPTSGSTGGTATIPTSGSTGGTAITPANSNSKPGIILQNPIKYDTFSDLVSAVIKAAVDILTPFVVLAFIWSGFLFVKAQGKPEEIKVAQNTIKFSIFGAFILFGAWGFAQIIGTTINTITK